MPMHAGQVWYSLSINMDTPILASTSEFGHGTGVCTRFLFSCEDRRTPCYARDKAKSMEFVHSYIPGTQGVNTFVQVVRQ